MFTRLSVALLVLCCLLASARQADTNSHHRMTLDVVVTEKGGTPVLDLQQQDFTLLDNKQPTPIVAFLAPKAAAVSNPPQEVVLLLDEVNTAHTDVATETVQLEKFLGRYRGKLPIPVSLVFFTDKGVSVGSAESQGPTSSAETLMAELQANRAPLRVIGRPQGFYGASERIDLSLRTLGQLAAYEQQRPGRKLVVWISPGWPLLSGPREDLSQKNQQSIFKSIVDLSGALWNARITLYSIDPLGTLDSVGLRTTYWQNFVKGIKKPSQVQLGNLALQVLAEQSGGLVLNSSNDVAGEVAQCLADADAFYQISFETQPAMARTIIMLLN